MGDGEVLATKNRLEELKTNKEYQDVLKICLCPPNGISPLEYRNAEMKQASMVAECCSGLTLAETFAVLDGDDKLKQ